MYASTEIKLYANNNTILRVLLLLALLLLLFVLLLKLSFSDIRKMRY